MWATSFWLELAYVFSLNNVRPLFKLTDYGILDVNPCTSPPHLNTSGGAITLNLTNVILPNTLATSNINLVQELNHGGSATYFRVQP